MLPIGFLAQTVLGLLQGPLTRLLEAHIADQALRQKLDGELRGEILAAFSKAGEEGAQIVLAETASEHWLTRSWRPMLMLILMGFLIFAGVILPFGDLLAGKTVPFSPRWQILPPQFWDFLSIGMGGYIGGRSLEKVAGLVFPEGVKKAVSGGKH